MSRILVTAIGSFSADVVITELKENNEYVVGCDINEKELLANALLVDKFYKSPLASDVKKYCQFVSDICEKNHIQYIIPLTDVEVDVLNEYRDELEKRQITVCISKYETIKLCRNKYDLYKYLYGRNLNWLIYTELLYTCDINKLSFPIVVKPYDGRSSQKLYYFENKEELQNFINLSDDISKYIVQPQIKGNIITVDVVRQQQQGFKAAIVRRELLRTLNGAGTSVYVFRNLELEKRAGLLSDLLDINGCVNFEFIETPSGEYFLIECNPRFSGGVKFSCMAGYNCILNHIRCFSNGDEVEMQSTINEMYIARKYNEYITKQI